VRIPAVVDDTVVPPVVVTPAVMSPATGIRVPDATLADTVVAGVTTNRVRTYTTPNYWLTGDATVPRPWMGYGCLAGRLYCQRLGLVLHVPHPLPGREWVLRDRLG